MKLRNQRVEVISFLLISCVIATVVASILNRVLNVMFLQIAVLTPLITGLIIYSYAKKRKKHNPFEKFVLSALASFALLTTLPLNLDRSFSVWMLANLKSTHINQQTISEKQLQEKLETFFSAKSGELNRRIEEQAKLGNISFHKKEIYLTTKGDLQVKINRVISRIFNLNPKYTSWEKPRT